MNFYIRNKNIQLDKETLPPGGIVGDNADYIANFIFDSEWDGKTKTARFRYENGRYVDVILTDDSCKIPIEVLKEGTVTVGVYAAGIKSTNTAYFTVFPSVLEKGGVPADPTPDVYNQILAKLDSLNDGNVSPEAIETALEEYLNRILTKLSLGYGEDGKLYIMVNGSPVGEGVEITGTITPPLEPTLVSINAVYTQGDAVIYPSTSLDDLKAQLVVTANYSDDSAVVLTTSDYTLSGVLAEGQSIVTVEYEGLTTTFGVVVSAEELPPEGPSETGNIVILTESVEVEQGNSATFVVSLDSAPIEGSQTVTITSSNENITVSPSILTFNADNYNVNQHVMVSADEDMEDTYDILLTLSSNNVADRYINVYVESIPDMPDIELVTAEASDFTYQITGDYINLKSYIGSKTAIDIPATMSVDGVDYTTRINYAGMGYSNTTGLFSGNTTIEAVRFAEGIECYASMKSANWMFYGCTALRAVWNMPEINTIKECFFNCIALEGVTGLEKSNDITDMSNAFRNNSSLSVCPKLGDLSKVTSFANAFSGCSSLTIMPDISTAIECTSLAGTFSGCTNIKRFYNIDKLTKVQSLTGTFKNCKYLTEMPDISEWSALTRIDQAFYGTSVTEVKDIPSGVTNMSYAFYDCTGLSGIANIYAEEVTAGNFCFAHTQSTLIVRMVADSTTYTTFTSLNVGATDGLSQYVIFKTFDESIDIPQISLCGDSLFAYSNPALFANMVTENNAVSYSFAFAGYTSYEIAAKQGGIPMKLSKAVTIPADKTAVEIEITNDDGYVFPKSTSHTNSSGNNPCYVGGVECTLSTDSEHWYLTRTTTGEAVEIAEGTVIITSQMQYHNNDILAIFMGQNGVWSTPDELISQYNRMLEYSDNGGKYVIVGLHSGTASERADLETAMAEAFGDHYINLRKYYVENGLSDAGLTPTEADTAAIAQGKTPPALMADGLHLNTYGATIMWTLIHDKMIELGYIS